MKYQLTAFGVLLTQFLLGQTFSESESPLPFQATSDGVIAFADIDGDGDQDVLITGSTNFPFGSTKLYSNDGAGHFTELENTPFEQLSYSAAAFSDVDGDGDADLLISGQVGTSLYTGGLYLNDGKGNFTIVADTPIMKAAFGDISFADVDNDGDQDVFINGAISRNEIYAKLYFNDGKGNFKEAQNTPFAPIAGASAFSDVDNDGDLDVLLAGGPVAGGTRLAKLYSNDGKGAFTEVPNTLFTGLASCDVAFSDVDGNGYEDVLISGHTNSYVGSTKLYLNEGGVFKTAATGMPFKNLASSKVAFADLDADGDEDVLISGVDNDFNHICNLFRNDAGKFALVENTPFLQIGFGAIGISDVDGDGDQDILMTGALGNGIGVGLYFNEFMTTSTTEFSISNPQSAFEPFFIYPFSANQIQVRASSNINQTLYLSVFNVSGQKITNPEPKQADIGEQTFLLELPDLSSGMYFLQIRGKDQVATKRFMAH